MTSPITQIESPRDYSLQARLEALEVKNKQLQEQMAEKEKENQQLLQKIQAAEGLQKQGNVEPARIGQTIPIGIYENRITDLYNKNQKLRDQYNQLASRYEGRKNRNRDQNELLKNWIRTLQADVYDKNRKLETLLFQLAVLKVRSVKHL